ncbi:MAG: hypothetical protein H7328_07450 [Bdellovibrio sp.]|nr:hypothetical protein [Bdellovibrio sp.]
MKSSNEIAFYAKKDLPFSEFGKIDEFEGQLVRLDEEAVQFSMADLYRFRGEARSKMSEQLCNTYADKIFGPESDRALKMKDSLVLFDTAVGKACAYKLKDTYARAKKPYAYAISGFIHGRLTILVWTLSRSPADDEVAKLRNFWKTLK